MSEFQVPYLTGKESDDIRKLKETVIATIATLVTRTNITIDEKLEMIKKEIKIVDDLISWL